MLFARAAQRSWHAARWLSTDVTSTSSSRRCVVASTLLGQGQTVALPGGAGEPLTWYACGPTVYDDAHLGHARTYVTFDIMRRLLEGPIGRPVFAVMGMTDVDDKIINRAAEAGETFEALATRFEARFMEDMDALAVRRPLAITRVSEHIQEIIDYTQRIVDKGYGYVLPSGVYFDTSKFGTSYGCCFRRGSIEADTADSGEASQRGKRSSRDFCLWKSAKPGEPSWPSPWGPGRPGWHIECSAMSTAVLGPHLHLHTGGIDLQFPHHTNEIAQCEAHIGQPGTVEANGNYQSSWVTTFLHTGHLYIDGLKMSKSLKNFITVRDFLKDHSPDAFRLFCLQNRYSANVNYSIDRIADAENLSARFQRFLQRSQAFSDQMRATRCTKWAPIDAALVSKQHAAHAACLDAVHIDFNTPVLVQQLLDLVTATNKYMDDGGRQPGVVSASANHLKHWLIHTGVTLNGALNVDGSVAPPVIGGSQAGTTEATGAALSAFVDFRAAVRQAAVENDRAKLFALCDQARNETLPKLGVQINDSKDGASVLAHTPSVAKVVTEQELQRKQQAREAQAARLAELQILPEQLFRSQTDQYSAFDDQGIPTHDSTGAELSKNARKKLEKKYKAHCEARDALHNK